MYSFVPRKHIKDKYYWCVELRIYNHEESIKLKRIVKNTITLPVNREVTLLDTEKGEHELYTYNFLRKDDALKLAIDYADVLGIEIEEYEENEEDDAAVNKIA